MYDVVYKRIPTIWNKQAIMAFRRDTNDSGVISSVMVYDEYKARYHNYEDGDVFIDLGMHIGTWTVLMGMLETTSAVYGVEPLPENFKLALKNIELNRLGNVTPIMGAIASDSNGWESIYYTDDTTKFGKTHKFIGSMLGGSGMVHRARKISLDDIFKKYDIKKCKVLKTDAEGGEIGAFRGISQNNLKKIDCIVGEFHPYRGIDFQEFFSYFEPYFEDISKHFWNEEGGLRRFMFKRV